MNRPPSDNEQLDNIETNAHNAAVDAVLLLESLGAKLDSAAQQELDDYSRSQESSW